MAHATTAQRPGQHTQPIVTRFLAKWLWSSPQQTLAESVGFQKRAYERAITIVRAFYAISVLWAFQSLVIWPQLAGRELVHPLWPTNWWFQHFSVRNGVNLIFYAYLVVSLIVLIVPQLRLARVAYAVVLLQYMALVNSSGKINHDLHAWLFVSVVLILLPKGPWSAGRRIAHRQYFLTVIWMAQLVLLLFYSLSGMWKIYVALNGLADGHVNAFNFSGFSNIVATRVLVTNQSTVLGSFFERNEMIGWALFLGTMYLEAFSLIIAFRPRLHRLWGVALIFFHIGTQLVLNVAFPENVVLVGLFFVCSPLAPERVDVKAMILDLPAVHFINRRLEFLRRRTA